MATQRDIAKATGLTQAAVSMALRGNPSISKKTCDVVRRAASKLGYRPNPLVSVLMAHVRSRKPIADHGCIAILADAANARQWLAWKAHQLQFEGMRQRATAAGYRTECFFLRHEETGYGRIDRILYNRGIVGVILAAPRGDDAPPLRLKWDRYAVSTVDYSWSEPVHRVAPHYRENIEIAFRKLLDLGYRRIGVCLRPDTPDDMDHGFLAGYLVMQSKLPHKQRIPLFLGYPEATPLREFQDWLTHWRPDALISLAGLERKWLRKMGKTFKDLPLVCLDFPQGDGPRIEENHLLAGAKAVDLVASQIANNERGLPASPTLLLVPGTWVKEAPLPRKRRGKRA